MPTTTQSPERVTEANDSRTEKREGGCAAPICYDWAVVWRGNRPVAAFPTREMAAGWISEAAHRSEDTISTWPNKKSMKEYWAEAQRRSRLKRKSHNADIRRVQPDNQQPKSKI